MDPRLTNKEFNLNIIRKRYLAIKTRMIKAGIPTGSVNNSREQLANLKTMCGIYTLSKLGAFNTKKNISEILQKLIDYKTTLENI